MSRYYSDKLAAQRLKRVYEIATPRVQQYLDAELAFVLDRIEPGMTVLDLGCGYGRTLRPMAAKAGRVVGIDTSLDSLKTAADDLADLSDIDLACMDAVRLAFRDHAFDLVVCIQNGISAFHVDTIDLIRESLRVTRPGGTAIFSSYSEKFWDSRLEWFQLQAAEGLLGEINFERTGNGRIVCEDGFTATTVTPARFHALAAECGVRATITEVDGSSVFCEIRVPQKI
ncbi:MAG: class I SAM-dependent methyltransferase [Candidatus Zixiibacteriota bacterium]|nr:MAG: class I SAM-dependent methyltransferase [candidate division Zixibacteria bacterium]